MYLSNETIRVIQTVAKYRNITLAAEQLNRVASAISYTVRQLEETLGVKLFDRKGRQLTLTPAGKYFITYSKAVLSDIETLKRNTRLAADIAEPELHIAVNNIIPSSLLVQFVEAFETTFPFTQLTLSIEVYNGCWDALYNHRVDLVIGAPHAVPYTDGIQSIEFGELSWDFVISADHPLSEIKKPLRNEQLRKYAAICIADTSITFTPQQAWLLEGQKPIFVPDYSIAMELIKRGVGIGYLPHHLCKEELQSGRLISKKMQEAKHSTKLFIAYQAGNLLQARQWCVDYLLQSERQKEW